MVCAVCVFAIAKALAAEEQLSFNSMSISFGNLELDELAKELNDSSKLLRTSLDYARLRAST